MYRRSPRLGKKGGKTRGGSYRGERERGEVEKEKRARGEREDGEMRREKETGKERAVLSQLPGNRIFARLRPLRRKLQLMKSSTVEQ